MMNLPEVPANGKFRILVVEDDAHIARLILLNLAKANMECLHAPDGAAGLARFKEANPHLVITDIMMPNLNGMEMTAKIREISPVPIIMMTAADSEEREMQGFKSGADDYVPKPFNPKLLMARVLANLRRVYRYDATMAAAASGAPSVTASAEPEEVAPPSSRSDWVTCDSCGYIGPRVKFQQTDSTGKIQMTCPVCKQSHVSFSIE
jgi:DNA-binding response OmpR family regulator